MGRLLEVTALSGGLSQWRYPHPGKGPKRQSACTTDRNGGSRAGCAGRQPPFASKISGEKCGERNDPPSDRLLQNAPNGGNKLQVEYALVDDVEQMDRLRTLASERMDALAACGIYPDGYDAKSFQDLKRAEETVRPDMLFCGAPHLLIPHAPANVGCGWQDTAIAGTYFELLCAAHGLGAILMSFCLDVLKRMPDVWSLLHIPDDHCVSMAIGFGYPMIPYARGVQREDAVRSEVLSFPAVS